MDASGTEETKLLNVNKLTSENYHSWKFQVKLLLLGKDLWDIVAGKEVLKDDPTEDETAKFRKREQQALSYIGLSVTQGQQIYLRNVDKPKAAWDVLAKHFEDKSLSKIIYYRRKLYATRLVRGQSMVAHVNNIRTLQEHLGAIGDEVTDKDLVIILLSSLPGEYNYLVTALETIDETKLTWDYVRDRVINEYEKKQCNRSVDESNALFVDGNSWSKKQRGGSSGRGQGSNRGGGRGRGSGRGGHDSHGGKTENEHSNVTCYKCHEKGHISRNCPKKKTSEDANMSNALDYAPEECLMTGEGSSKDDWLIDSGATSHMTYDESELHNFKEFEEAKAVGLADESVVHGYGSGDIHMKIYDVNGEHDIKFQDVLYVPNIKKKLISIPVLDEKKVKTTFFNGVCVLDTGKKSYEFGHKHGKLYKVNNSPKESCCVVATLDMGLWHKRFGHLGYENLKKMSKEGMVSGMSMKGGEPNGPCEGCLTGKQSRLPFPKKGERSTTKPLELIHSDVCGPMNVPSMGNSRYFITFIDDYSRYHTVYALKSKDEALQKFKEFAEKVENRFGYKIKGLRSDNGGEYVSNEFEDFLKERGITHEPTIPYSPQQNGIAERANRTLMETVRCLLHQGGVPLRFWAEALSVATYLKNCSPTSCFGGETPHERWWNVKPDVSKLKVFGCIAYAHIPREKRKKLDKKTTKCIFVGYPENSKGYKLYDPTKREMFRSRDVIFDEYKVYDDFRSDDEPEELLPSTWVEAEIERKNVTDEESDVGETNENERDDDDNDDDGGGDENNNDDVLPRSERQRRAPIRYGEPIPTEYASIAASNIEDEPQSIEEAMDGQDSVHWKNAIDSEMDSLVKNGTWELTDLPVGKSTVGSKWVFKKKRGADGIVNRYKARLVAQGYTQRKGIDYREVFSPVVRYSSVRILLAIANQYDMEIHQMDVMSAYLNGVLEEEIYMKQPTGYINPQHPNKVCRLIKSIYGLKQSARCWNSVIDEYLKSEGYTSCPTDFCVYIKVINNTVIIIIALFVDDTVICCNHGQTLMLEKKKLRKRFEMKDQGEIHYFLGMSIKRDRKTKTMTIDQALYIEKVLKRFSMNECNPVSIPLESGMKFQKSDDSYIDITNYQAAIGSLIYAAISTRPDISISVGILSQYMTNPSIQHWNGVKRILRYLKGTMNFGLCFKQSENFVLTGFSDSDWAGDESTRKSMSGFIFRLGESTISWGSKKQSVVALSTTEAEYIALSLATQEAVWLRNLLGDLHLNQKTTTIFEDNQGTIALSNNPTNHSRTKHIDIKYHYVRDLILKKQIDVSYCPTNEMVADIFTKGLPRVTFEHLRAEMGVVDVGDSHSGGVLK